MGEYVSTDKRLFQVVDNKHLHCAFRIYEKDILKVKEGQQIEVSSPSFRNQTFTATIYAISPAFEESPKSLHIHADFEKHDDRLISGMYVTGKIKSDSISRTVLPRNAVVVEDGKKYVFIKSTNEMYEDEHNHHEDKLNFLKMEVTTGIEQDDWIEILNASNFTENSKIVLKSAYYLQAEIGKGETEHSH
jgi:cobalt-zinc-cadmium efflux system membrane fusion protein